MLRSPLLSSEKTVQNLVYRIRRDFRRRQPVPLINDDLQFPRNDWIEIVVDDLRSDAISY